MALTYKVVHSSSSGTVVSVSGKSGVIVGFRYVNNNLITVNVDGQVIWNAVNIGWANIGDISPSTKGFLGVHVQEKGNDAGEGAMMVNIPFSNSFSVSKDSELHFEVMWVEKV
jgi:hypothetical protein